MRDFWRSGLGIVGGKEVISRAGRGNFPATTDEVGATLAVGRAGEPAMARDLALTQKLHRIKLGICNVNKG